MEKALISITPRDHESPVTALQREILRPLAYYDIWAYPLTAQEIFAFLQVNSVSFELVLDSLERAVQSGIVCCHTGYYFLPSAGVRCVGRRQTGERHARRLWHLARFSAHILKRMPFVRAVFVSGELSKNTTSPGSDVDFVVLTEPGRLWIARTLLILFKKTALLNRKRFFCLNTFVAVDHLDWEERNVYSATEVAHLKALFNSGMYRMFMEANSWIHEIFPNFRAGVLPEFPANDRPSIIQRLLEAPFRFLPSDRLDRALQHLWERVWERRYPQFDVETRGRIFRSTRSESRAYPGDFQRRILDLYRRRLQTSGVSS